jgi:hypothetical protein
MTCPTSDITGSSVMAAMQLKTTLFNNAGTDYFRSGDYEDAWGLFKGALEVVLETERVLLKSKVRSSSDRKGSTTVVVSEIENESKLGDTYLQEAISSNQFIQKAESLMLSSRLNRISTGLDESSALVDLPLESESDSDTASLGKVRMHQSTFRLNVNSCPIYGNQIETKLRSAKIIFNLALVEHVVDPYSQNIVELYELSSNLITKEYIIDPVQVAVINNIAVWFYENDNMDAAQLCMEYLGKEVEEHTKVSTRDVSPNSVSMIPDHTTKSIQIPKNLLSLILSNIHFILTPPYTVSAAA